MSNKEPLEIWEAMDLVGLSKKQYLAKQSPASTRKLTEEQIKEARGLYWCHRWTIMNLATKYEVAWSTMEDCIKRRNAYDPKWDVKSKG